MILSALLPSGCIEPKSLGSLEEGGESVDDSAGGDPTGGSAGKVAPEGCPEGQASTSMQWTAMLEGHFTMDHNSADQLLALPDGKILYLLSDLGHGTGFFVIEADGTFGGTVLGPASGTLARWVARTDSGEIVVLARRWGDEDTYASLARYDPDLTPLGEVELDIMVQPTAFLNDRLAAGDRPVIAGYDVTLAANLVAKVDPGTGATVWSAQLDDTPEHVRGLAVGPAGEVVVVVHGSAGYGEALATYHVWTFAADGAPLWDRVYAPTGLDAVIDVEFAPGGRLLLLANGDGDFAPETLELIALDAADGSPLWERTLADKIDKRYPFGHDLLVEGDSITAVIGRSRSDYGYTSDPSVQRATLDGSLFGEVPLQFKPLAGHPAFHVVRGACGNLVVLQRTNFSTWVVGVAP